MNSAMNTWPFVAALVYISGGVVIDAKHRNQTVGRAVSTCDVSAGGPNAVDIQSYTSGGLRYNSALFQSVVNAFYAVLRHR